jgi:replicative DNA helicase
MLAVGEAGQSVDFITVSEQLQISGGLERIGGHEYLGSIQKLSKNLNLRPTEEKAKEYAEIVKRYSLLRTIISEMDLIKHSAYFDEKDPRALIDEAVSKLFNISGELSASQVWYNECAEIAERMIGKGKIEISTGFNEIDKTVFGLVPGWLWVIGARPKIGKTAFLLNLADNTNEQGHSALIFERSETMQEVILKLASLRSNVELAKLMAATYRGVKLATLEETKTALQLLGQVKDNNNLVISSERFSLERIITRAKIEKEQHPNLRLIGIDCLQSFPRPEKRQNRSDQLGEIVFALKELAQDTHTTVVLLSQLVRDVEKRKDKRPRDLSDFKDCGDIEAAVDVGTFLYRPEFYWPEKEEYKGWSSCIIAANRFGPSKTVRLGFTKETGKYNSV